VVITPSQIKPIVAKPLAGQVSRWVKSVTLPTRKDTWLPFTERLILKPDWAYVTKSALMARVFLGFSRSWLNQPAFIDDPRLSAPQKQQAFGESSFKELFGTPFNMILMHLGADLTGGLLQRFGFVSRQLSTKQPNTIKPEEWAKADKWLHELLGKKGWVGQAVFDNQHLNLTAFKQALKAHDLGHLLKDPVFEKTVIHWFTRLKIAGSLCFVAQMVVNMAFGGYVVQQANDRLIAPLLQRWLYQPERLAKAEAKAANAKANTKNDTTTSDTSLKSTPSQNTPPQKTPPPDIKVVTA
jgi:hypothetical protein